MRGVFERFSERARQVIVFAQDEARTLKHNYIGTEHLLLGMLREEEGLAARVLASLEITVEKARAGVARIVGQGDEVTIGQIPFTPRAKKVLELALSEALAFGDNHIGTEHILLGLVRVYDGIAARILRECGADPERVRTAVEGCLEEGRRRPGTDRPPQRRWEHAVTPLGPAAELSPEQFDAMAQDGWELVTVVGAPDDLRGLFRRRA